MRREAYIGYSVDPEIRYKATSGGVGSALVRYLFEVGLITHVQTFRYDAETLTFFPALVSSFADYSITGSIYQEMDMLGFYKNNLTREIVGDGCALLFTLPCQTKFVRMIAKKNKINVLVIGLTCSSQQSLSATQYLLARLAIGQNEVCSLQYRGNGWPSGIQIGLRSGKTEFVSNLNSDWTRIFHSRLFCQPRCFFCQNTLNDYSDISLADPWLDEYVKKETIGQTLYVVNTEIGMRVVAMALKEHVIVGQSVEMTDVVLSQQGTINRKQTYANSPMLRGMLKRLVSFRWYRKLVLSSACGWKLFSLHMRIISCIERLMCRHTRKSICGEGEE